MPTGYTSAIYKADTGNQVSLEEYALMCAHAFIPYDQSIDAEIPAEEGEISSYYSEGLSKAYKCLASVKSWTTQKAAAESRKAHKREVSSTKEFLDQKDLLLARYKKMMKKVKDWKVPSSHQALKDFMIEQLNSAIKFDCGGSYFETRLEILLEEGPKSGEVFKQEKIEEALANIEYYSEKITKEKKDIESRNEWVKGLYGLISQDDSLVS